MAHNKWTPIVVGVGDIKNRSQKVEDAIEPMVLMYQAALQALRDTGLSSSACTELQSSIDHLGVVNTWTWLYSDLPSLLSQKLDITPTYQVLSHHGGDSPAKLFDEAARRIALGESKVALVAGGEAMASLIACSASGKLPPPGWTEADTTGRTKPPSDGISFADNLGTRHSIGLPIQIYPLYENGFRAHRGQSVADNNRESAELYADFAKVAERSPLAWNYGQSAATREEIGTVSKKNRMICSPYPLLMNAFNNVNLAASCILTSTEYASELGIPKEKWIYPLGGAGTSDSAYFWERPNYHSSPAISRSLDEALKASNLRKEDIDLFDFYSCFPIVPKLACHHLGLPVLKQAKPITLLGGLTSFGGAGNNYSMHAITAMVRELRQGKENSTTGLVLANGGVLTYQYVVCLSSKPRNAPYPECNPLSGQLAQSESPEIEDAAEGEGVIETYTVEFHRDGSPLRGHVVGRLTQNGRRFLANHGDEGTLKGLASREKEQVGRRGLVRCAEDGRNLFSLERVGKL